MAASYTAEDVPSTGLSWFMETMYGPFLLKSYTKVLVFAICIGFTVNGIYSIFVIGNEFDPNGFTADGSYILSYNAKNSQYFASEGGPIVWGVVDGATGFEIPAVQADYFALQVAFETSLYMPGVSNFWLRDFVGYTEAEGIDVSESDDFYMELEAYVTNEETGGTRYAAELIWVDDADVTQGLKVSRMSGNFRELDGSDENIDAMRNMQSNVVNNCPVDNTLTNPDGELICFGFSYAFLFAEQYIVIEQELYQNLGLAVLAVWAIVFIFIPSFITSGLVAFCVILTLIQVIGLMYLNDFDINVITATLLILAVGFSVDYAVHMAHYFMNAQGNSRDERMIYAFKHVGGSVVNGAFSTFLAIVVLAGAASEVFQTVFYIFLFCVIFGTFQGLAVLPVALSLVGPPAHAPHKTPKSAVSYEATETGTASL